MSQKYTRETVAENNGKDGKPTWIIYKNSVYDVTSYLDDHPGGAYLIEEWAGKDLTKAFNQAGHSSDAEDQLVKYKIGEVEKENTKNKLSNGNKQDSIINEATKEKIKKEKRRIKLFFCM